jgi:competence protein ComEC
VSLLLLTHFHADHVEGVPGVLRGRKVAEVEGSPLHEPPEEYDRVQRWTREAGVPLTTAAVGEVRTTGPVQWRVLWPAWILDEGSRPNNASVVVRLTTQGVVLLLTGDVEPAAQAALLADEGSIRAEVLKVPHHGSANQDPAFLRDVGAGIALVSAGVGNPYGHPAPSTIDLLRRLGMQVGRTDTEGDLAVVAVAGGVTFVPRHPP